MRHVLVCLVLAACSSSSSKSVDAPSQMDGSAGPMCTGAVYDPCVNPSDCMSMMCHFYMMSNFTVCTQACTPGDNTTCPLDATGAHGFCNPMGNCKPAVANNCHR
jgi:hypothetical protein